MGALAGAFVTSVGADVRALVGAFVTFVGAKVSADVGTDVGALGALVGACVIFVTAFVLWHRICKRLLVV